MKAYRGNGVRILLDVVRDGADALYLSSPTPALRAPQSVVRAWRALQGAGLVPLEREAFGVLLLDARHRAIGFQVIAVGTLNSAPIHPREVFRAAIGAGAARIVIAHNHPSGDCTPSPEDYRITERLTKAGELLGIEVLDHVVIGATHFFSCADSRRRSLSGLECEPVPVDVEEP